MDRSAGCTLCQNRFYRDIASWREYLNTSALSNMYRFLSLLLVYFMPKCSVLCFSGLFQRVLSCKCVILCLFSCMHDTLYFHFAFAQISLQQKKIPFRTFIFRSVYNQIQIWLKRMIHSFETFLINVPTWGRVDLISVCSLCNVIIWLQKTLI